MRREDTAVSVDLHLESDSLPGEGIIQMKVQGLGNGLSHLTHIPPHKARYLKVTLEVIALTMPAQSLDFLGFTCRYDRDLKGRDKRYLNVFPSQKSVARRREMLRRMTSHSSHKPLLLVIEELNSSLRGWANYYRCGYPRKAVRAINRFVRERFRSFLRNRSQRHCKPFRKGESLHAGLKRYGLIYL